jgi:molybdopterin synthase catalytic subunit
MMAMLWLCYHNFQVANQSTMAQKSFFMEGNIKPEFISQQITSHQSKTNIGAHAIFLGQVRADERVGKKVVALEYSAYNEMAEKTFNEIREEIFAKYNIICLHVFHSLGKVRTGEVSMFVFLSAAHRQETFDALHEMVDAIKLRVPIWKKEIFDDGTETWLGEK